jgi:hypothetical protein
VIGFLNPALLVGLALAGLPPLLHLLGRRQPPTVPFPAVRYLTAAEREHSRKLKLRNLLLMALRMAVIVCIALAAARPVVPWSAGSSHPPAAVAVILDNSLSSGAIVEGRPVLDGLRQRARAVAARLSPDDQLWVVTADGIPQMLVPAQLAPLLDTLADQPIRLDLGDAVRSAATVLGETNVALQEIVVVSDLQATAVSSGEPVPIPVIAAAPPAAPANAGVDSLAVEPPVWTESGEIIAALGGARDEPVAVRLLIGGRERARTVGRAGDPVVLQTEAPGEGWLTGSVQLDPDELRADDQRWFAVRATSPVGVEATTALGAFLSEALNVLIEAGRLRSGATVALGDRPTAGPSVVFPPAEPAMLGATNRALAAAGISWRFGELLDGEWALDAFAPAPRGAAVFKRYRLRGGGTVVARAGGEPWLVRDGLVTIVASRLLPDWTTLPTSASFLPFVHRLVAEVAVGEAGVLAALTGQPTAVPTAAVALSLPTGDVRVPDTGVLRAPVQPGVYALTDAAADTVGMLEVNHDPRESLLTPATEATIRAAWGPAARIVSERALETSLFGGTARAELTTVFLVAALVAALAELALSSAGTGVIRR